VEQLFPCSKPPVGQAHASVLVDDDGIAIVHRLVKGQVEVPKGQIAAVVRDPGPVDGQVVLRREPRQLDLVTNQYNDPNVLVVFDPPVRIERFSYGANQVLAINRRERKQGVALDSIGVTVDDPDGLTAAIARLGARVEPAVTDVYVRIIGQAYGEEAATIRQHAARRRRWARILTPLFLAIFTVAMAARIGVGDGDGDEMDVGHVGAIVAAALAWACGLTLVAVATAPTPAGPTTSGRPGARTAYTLLGVAAALTLIPLVSAGWLHSHLGIPRTVTLGFAAGGPGGLFNGWALRALPKD
jgi:hypothetical protein